MNLVFKDQANKKWLEGRFDVGKDILDDSWAVQAWKKEGFAQGLAEGEIKGEVKGMIEGSRKALLLVFQARFPEAVPALRIKINSINEYELLQRLVIKTSVAKTSEEALEALFTVKFEEKKE